MAKDDRKEDVEDIPRERAGRRPDFSTPPPRKALPKELQDTLNNEENLWEDFYEGTSEDSTDTPVRYAAYASRIRTIMMSAHRYVAYTSDIGESFRPVAHPYIVRGAYAVSWLYLTGDVANEGYKAYCRNQRVLHPELHMEKEEGKEGGILKDTVKKVGQMVGSKEDSVLTGREVIPGRVPAIEDYRAVMAQRAVFQAVASMGLPAFTIHSIVKYSGRAMKNVKNKTIRTWGPIGLGLSVVPFLPYIFDEPVEQATEWIFHQSFKAIGGARAVEGRPVTGNKELRHKESVAQAHKKKEL
ncbi:hypothetical protein CC78DRAFT_534982 [Lojkania enalia]|uniref:Mitochondrial fission process protein 1 n=1 Tax=Lojkania enalia TaxID=147567 RepID=A0A9P4K528_9PLEO|nr:hypothetical protein CC78DRAFT_534982 [Didymosphaeria enalia]